MRDIIGKKIKERRKALGLTQSQLAGDTVTRNMLSLIESGKTTPSIGVLAEISEKLQVPPEYLISENESLFYFEKREKIEHIKMLFKTEKYDMCMDAIDSLMDTDDELSYIYANAAFYHGKSLMNSGALLSAKNILESALKHCEKTLYSTKEIRITSRLYLAVCENIQSPLLELDTAEYLSGFADSYDCEFFKYITPDLSFEYTNPIFKKHIDAKIFMRRYRYKEAIEILLSLEELKKDEFNATVLFNVYSDLEISYRQIGNFEKAYRYSNKKFALLNVFKS